MECSRRERRRLRYWLRFAPTLHITDAGFLARGRTPFFINPATVRQGLIQDGFFELAPPEDDGLFEDGGGWGLDVAELGKAMVALGAGGWPPVYALVFDEVWVLRARLGAALNAACGLEANFDFAAFHARRRRGNRLGATRIFRGDRGRGGRPRPRRGYSAETGVAATRREGLS